MAKRLYVGNLSYETTDDDMKTLFSQYGEVSSANVLVDRMSGRSRGFGFVEMADDAAAQAAIDALNGQEHNGRKLVVNEARPQSDRNDRPRRSFGGGGGRGRGGFGGGREDY